MIRLGQFDVCLYHTFLSRLYNANRDVNIAARACRVPCTFLSRKQRACRQLPCAFLSWYYKSFPNIFLQFLPWASFLISSNGIIRGPSRILSVFCPHCSQTSTHVKKCSSHWTWKQTWPTRSPPSDCIRTPSSLLMSKCFKPNAEYEHFTCCKITTKMSPHSIDQVLFSLPGLFKADLQWINGFKLLKR